MALILPPPQSAREELADTLLRQIEVVVPILPGTPPSQYVERLMDARALATADPLVPFAALVRLLGALPERRAERQFATLVVLLDTPLAVWAPRLRAALSRLLAALELLYGVAFAAPPPSLDQLAARARLIADPLANPPGPDRLSVGELTAYRTAYRALRDRVDFGV